MSGAVTVQDVLDRVEHVQHAGAGYLGRCPAHDDRHASLSIAAGERVPVVLSCKAGCAFEDVAAALGFANGELTRSGEDRPDSRRALVATYTYRNVDGSIFARKERFTDDVGGKNFLWSRPDPDNASHWISGTKGEIPLYRLPELIGTPMDKMFVIVEGEKDADRLAALGFVATTTPNGATPKWRESDSQYFARRRVCVIADDDEPGRKKAADTAAALKNVAAAVGVVTLPNPNHMKGFDASDFLDAGGSVEELARVIENFASPRLPPEIVTLEDLTARVLRLYRNDEDPGIYVGWEALRNLYKPRAGELTVGTGAPNAGKSTFFDALMVNTVTGDHAWRWIVFSPEYASVERHVAKLLQKILNMPFGPGPCARMTEEQIHDGLRVVDEHFTLVDPARHPYSIDSLLEIAEQANKIRKHHGLLVDPYNVLAASSRTQNVSEHEFINELLTKLKAFAQREEAHAVIVAHPTKLKPTADGSDYPPIRPWDISGSAHWYNHADAIISIWRSLRDESGEVDIHISKIRFAPECGTLGTAKLYFDRVTTRYSDLPRSARSR